jgi:hypothetical protein
MPGTRPDPHKYARPERERRFVLAAVPPGAGEERRIVDRYVRGTRLRLREVGEGPGAVRKLGQKVRPDEADARVVLHTTMYLDPPEFEALSALPAAVLVKRRSWIAVPHGRRLAVDVFEGSLRGLVLAEIELGDETDAAAFVAPEWVLAEVTGDERFTGGRLAVTDRADLRAALADVVGADRAGLLLG